MVHRSSSWFGVIINAINHVYILKRVQMPEIIKRDLSTFILGMDRTVIVEKQMLGLKFSEGKNPSASRHMRSCEDTILKQIKGGYFCTSIPSFRLVTREKGGICVNSKINHIRFHGDCLVFEFANSKVHQKGENNLGHWHVYEDPSIMWMCPVLSLLRYLFFYPDILKVDVQLFEERSQYTRCAMQLTKIVK